MTQRPAFQPVPTELDFPKYEQAILRFWKEQGIIDRALEEPQGDRESFVFYEGPPTANGLPHNGHVLTRVMKDLFPRYQQMQGKWVLRKGGWDTHGLPVEVEVEKELRIHGKAAIEEYGVRPFVGRCIDSVFRYTSEWERLTERIGFWVNLPEAYVTYHKSYVESVWWALSQLFEKGLLYQGHKVVWWWAQGGTALSSAEVGLGYKTVDDPSVYALFPLEEDRSTAIVVWTTTPWTLPSNAYAAVRADVDYAYCRLGEPLAGKKGATKERPAIAAERLILAEALRPALEAKLGYQLVVEKVVKGSELVGLRYVPPFDVYYQSLAGSTVRCSDGTERPLWWRVIAEDFVTLDTGTGIVHIAPAFGEDDNRAHQKQLRDYVDPLAVELLCCVVPDGTFSSAFPAYAGRWVKDCDKELLVELHGRGRLLHHESYRHDYPFCWRADEDPLLQMARPAWFIRTTKELERAKANNMAVSWHPPHIQEGRFGDFLKNNVDWALSRERFWGTPLNVWQCAACGHQHAPSSVAALEELNPHAFDHWKAAKAADPSLNDHLQVHKPWIDEVHYPCPKCQGQMNRVTEVIDCWFDSGCMPFAQWGYPHLPGSVEKFQGTFPADFISEAIDQTRGWFYSLLMVSTLVFDEETQVKLGLTPPRQLPLPYKNCIVLGHVCDKEGKKESKSKGNYTPPELILDRVGMEFAVLGEVPGVSASEGEAFIAREDLEGMDLNEGAEVVVTRQDRPAERFTLKLQVGKKLPRRVIALPASVRAALALEPAKNGLNTMPVEVPRLPQEMRVLVSDENTPAPGADAFRWFFYASSAPWNNTRHSLRNVRMLQKDFIVKLRNVYSFFVIYANIDGWSPAESSQAARPVAERHLLDRLLLSELNLAIGKVRAGLDGYDAFEAAQALVDFVETLSNWYVRRSRARFWAPGLEADKLDAYATLHHTLVTFAKLMAPFVPFFAEELYQNLAKQAGVAGADSVHLDRFPEVDAALIDAKLSEEIRAVREIVSLGLAVRTQQRLKVRQPLDRADVVFNDQALLARLEGHRHAIVEELNVQDLRFMHSGHVDGAVSFKLKPNFRALGPRLGKNIQAVSAALAQADGSALFAELSQSGKLTLIVGGETMSFSSEEIQVQVEAAEGFAAETGKVGVVVLHTALTDALIDAGYLREVVSRLQAERKEQRFEFTDRIRVTVAASPRLARVIEAGRSHIQEECLAPELELVEALPEAAAVNFGEEELRILVQKL